LHVDDDLALEAQIGDRAERLLRLGIDLPQSSFALAELAFDAAAASAEIVDITLGLVQPALGLSHPARERIHLLLDPVACRETALHQQHRSDDAGADKIFGPRRG